MGIIAEYNTLYHTYCINGCGLHQVTDGCRLQVVDRLPQVCGNPQVEQYHRAAVESTSGKTRAKESVVNMCYQDLQLLLTVNPSAMGSCLVG